MTWRKKAKPQPKKLLCLYYLKSDRIRKMDEIDIQLVHGKKRNSSYCKIYYNWNCSFQFLDSQQTSLKKIKIRNKSLSWNQAFHSECSDYPWWPNWHGGIYGGPFIFNYKKKYRNDMYLLDFLEQNSDLLNFCGSFGLKCLTTFFFSDFSIPCRKWLSYNFYSSENLRLRLSSFYALLRDRDKI